MAFIGAVGTVSVDGSNNQTGDIMQGGSNSNGYYVRFADGTLINHDKYYENVYPSSTWSSLDKQMYFASAYVNNNETAVATFAAGHNAGAYYVSLETYAAAGLYTIGQSAGVNIHVRAPSGQSWNYYDVSFMAVGRWWV